MMTFCFYLMILLILNITSSQIEIICQNFNSQQACNTQPTCRWQQLISGRCRRKDCLGLCSLRPNVCTQSSCPLSNCERATATSTNCFDKFPDFQCNIFSSQTECILRAGICFWSGSCQNTPNYCTSIGCTDQFYCSNVPFQSPPCREIEQNQCYNLPERQCNLSVCSFQIFNPTLCNQKERECTQNSPNRQACLNIDSTFCFFTPSFGCVG